MDQDKIRNFCIIAHIDHGKSTLADRLLESTNTIQKREMREQVLDMMDLERERGITIKLQPARMDYAGSILNLIDTPGHVDFNYEVSRSLAAVEGALLLVDATQGIQAQTLGNLYLAMEQNLTIIPVINKIDLANAEIEKTKEEIISLLGCKSEEIILASGKTGKGVEEVLESVVKKVPSPNGEADKPLRALIFDSKYDDYKGVVAYVRVRDGEIKKGDKMFLMAGKVESEVLEVGYFKPQFVPTDKLSTGEIGYIVTGLKEIEKCRVGDTVTASTSRAEVSALPGYKEVKPMVFAGVFCKEGNDFPKLREAMLKLKLNDASLTFETEQSKALGFGFRCGLLGLLHLEILEERIRREYNLDVIITVPSVAYKITNRKGNAEIVKSPLEFPDPTFIEMVEEPWIKIDVVSPSQYLGGIMQLVQEKRGVYINTEYLEADRIIIHYEVPLSAILVDFYDKLKSVTSGYGSLNYEFLGYKKTDVVKMDILVAGESVEALSTIVYEDIVHDAGRRIVEALKKVLPRQMFEVKIQAAIGGKIVASEHLPAMKKDVTAKLYGGDVTRKRKLLEKQKKGKKKMKALGKVDIPPEAFMAVLKK
ncbi:elongation factor 4 [Candidatus Falkowbacteria bacterium RIFOXYB2_FULL_38_15]|uniref:Elongation factor 4 n=1 Tax=Candidatus Falkowbacteria bacterium RIFOXYA2_FULL_38_12 TaxID=1797993 RepID=A0A1F5S3L1_9BACT|nr:MAG: elongation factor 4 [Candidatus Falkowbacteria bacterium RIFOXYA2_FULL_38_12]OGF33288.1 MAG: elongation factor 4 [Candidatus Falkowbacteria bacterium RIFOXYB2_FULL_38_15]OGF42337.1 MAG: elongation factor 4 [Candidatus Falkowbacteria bacterium RIFOXYD2_FULL_39_16]